MLTLLEVKRHGQGICHNVQSVNYSSALIQLGKPTKVNDRYQIKSMPQQPLICKSALKKKKKVDTRTRMVILSWWNCIWTDNLPEIYIPFPALQQSGKGVCFSGCKFIRLEWRWQALVINGRKLGHNKLWEPIKYDTAIEQTWQCRVCWQASISKPPTESSNKERDQPSRARREHVRKADASLRAPCLHSSKLGCNKWYFQHS